MKNVKEMLHWQLTEICLSTKITKNEIKKGLIVKNVKLINMKNKLKWNMPILKY